MTRYFDRVLERLGARVEERGTFLVGARGQLIELR